MNLFHFREESPSCFLARKRLDTISKLVSYMRYKQDQAGYKEINTPEILTGLYGKNLVIGKIWSKHVYF